MSKRLPTGPDRLNFTLALLGYLNESQKNDVSLTAGDIAEHFDVALSDINEALRFLDGVDIQRLGKVHSQEDTPYQVYWGFADDSDDAPVVPFGAEDYVDFAVNEWADVNTAPQFSADQVTALVTGLQYLRSLPDDSAAADIDELIEILSKGRHDLLAKHIEYRPGTTSATVEQIQSAIVNQKRISCSYVNQKGIKSVRQMDPLRIDPRSTAWQLRAWCHEHDEPRNFAIDRMSDVSILDAVPWCAEAVQHEIAEEADYIARETDVEVLIEVDPEGYDLVKDFNGQITMTNKSTGVATATLKIGYLPYFGRAVARYGGAVRVLEPAAAREVVRDYALNALKLASDRKGAE